MTVATPQDVAVAIGRPVTDETEVARVQYWLNAVEMQIVARLGPVANLNPGAVLFVETEAVAARMQNPEGYQSETIDDYTYRHGTETRTVTVREEWWALLRPPRRSRAFSVQPS